MQFMTSLFGGSGGSILTAVLALGLVLVMIVAGVWLLKLVFGATSKAVRGHNRRISVVDALHVDAKRQLLIVRRDDVEHLILTGGPQDVVVESGIPVKDQPATVRRPVPQQPAVAAAPVPVPPARPKTIVQPLKPVPVPVPPAARVIDGDAAPAPRTSIERLRDFTRPAGQRAAPHSLRHTGLMRPVSRMEPGYVPGLAENTDTAETDSATSSPVEPRGRHKGGDGNFGAYRGDIRADGNT